MNSLLLYSDICQRCELSTSVNTMISEKKSVGYKMKFKLDRL